MFKPHKQVNLYIRGGLLGSFIESAGCHSWSSSLLCPVALGVGSLYKMVMKLRSVFHVFRMGICVVTLS